MAWRIGAVAEYILSLSSAPRFGLRPRLEDLRYITMAGRAHLLQLRESLVSLVRCWSAVPAVTLLSDGTWSEVDGRKWFDWWPNDFVVRTPETVRSNLKSHGHAKLAKFTQTHPLSLKLGFIVNEALCRKSFFVDSDILWLKDPVEKLRQHTWEAGVAASVEPGGSFNRDLALKVCPSVLEPPFTNTGFVLLCGELFGNRSKLDETLEMISDAGHEFNEQTVIAIAVRQNGQSLSKDFLINEFEAPFDLWPKHLRGQSGYARHYVRFMRHLLYRDALLLRMTPQLSNRLDRMLRIPRVDRKRRTRAAASPSLRSNQCTVKESPMKTPIRLPKIAPQRPTFLIIGSAKCGTTTLASILDRHPDCCFSHPKEVNFFQETLNGSINPHYAKGWDWYQQAWAHYQGQTVIGEATPAYAERARSSSTAKRIHQFNADFRIVYLVRHPLERQISAWKMHYYEGAAKQNKQYRGGEWALRGFEHWLRCQKSAEQWSEVKYDFQLEAYREFFPAEQILVSFLKDWNGESKGEIERILKFLGLNPQRIDLKGELAVNRADDRRVEAKWARTLRLAKMTPKLSPFVPKSVKPLLLNKLILRKFPIPEPVISSQLISEFRSYVAEDNARFLARYGKPADFWDAGWNHRQ